MALNAKKAPSSAAGAKIEPLEAGSYPARVVQIIDLGLQEQRPYLGQPKPPANEIRLVYELTDEFLQDEDGNDQEDKPRWLSEDLPLRNLAAEKAKSTQRYMALDPKLDFDGDFTELLEVPCNVTVVQNPGKGANVGKVYNNIAGISTMRAKDAQRLPALVNKPVVFELETPDMEVFDALPDWLQDKIKGNLEFNGSALQKALGGEPTAGADEGDNNDEEW